MQPPPSAVGIVTVTKSHHHPASHLGEGKRAPLGALMLGWLRGIIDEIKRVLLKIKMP